MVRRGLTAAAGICSLLAATKPMLGAERPLNVILLLVDDMGWTGASCYGSDLHETPSIDRLAGQGVRFTNAYAAAPVCTPTRASIMTGKSPARLHMTIWRESAVNRVKDRKLLPPDTVADLPQSEVTIAEVLEAAAYLTAHVGKWHLGDGADYPENHGFRVNVGGTLWGCPATFFYPFAGPFGGMKEMRYVPGLAWSKSGDYLTDRLTDEALEVIDKAGDRPFFLNVCFYTVHTPIEGKREYVERYRKKIRPGMDHDNAHYAAMHQSLDENVGRILARLEQRGLADRTLVIFSSDNGGYVNAYRGKRVTGNRPLRSGKGSLYEGGLRVPLIVRWPGVTQGGGVCDEPVVSTDFYPTLLDATGRRDQVKHAAELEGVSLAPLLKDPRGKLDREALHFHYPHYYPTTTPVSAVRVGDWKLLHFYEDDHVELYNLKDDIGETKDLAGVMPEKAKELRLRLEGWLKRTDAQGTKPNPDAKKRGV
ncbi:MAG: sulfatase [Phycisphaerae bacterium]|nr:sulfatase [Phycisphaerae bacterium]